MPKTSDLYAPSEAVVSMLPGRFAKVEKHDDTDRESADLLWLEFTPDDAFSEGEVLKIEPATDDHALWFACLDSAYRFGGWPTSWSMTGTSAEVISGVQEALAEYKK